MSLETMLRELAADGVIIELSIAGNSYIVRIDNDVVWSSTFEDAVRKLWLQRFGEKHV